MINETPLVVSRENILKDVELIFRRWTNGSKYLVSHYLSPIEFRYKASFTGTDHELLEWVKNFPYKLGNIYVVSDHNIVYDMEKLRPELCFHTLTIEDDSTHIQKQNVNGTRQIIEPSRGA